MINLEGLTAIPLRQIGVIFTPVTVAEREAVAIINDKKPAKLFPQTLTKLVYGTSGAGFYAKAEKLLRFCGYHRETKRGTKNQKNQNVWVKQ